MAALNGTSVLDAVCASGTIAVLPSTGTSSAQFGRCAIHGYAGHGNSAARSGASIGFVIPYMANAYL